MAIRTGTAAQINAALAGLAYAGNPDFNGADTLEVATSDGTATDTDTITITVNAVNDAPVNTVPGAQSVAEDTALPIAGVSVADIDSNTLTTTLSVSSGTLNVTAGPGVTGNGTASVTITGTAAQINTALAALRLYRQPQLQRRRHAHGRDQRRDRRRHRHDGHHCECGERRPGQHRAGGADRRRGHLPTGRGRLGGRRGRRPLTTTLWVTHGILTVTAGATVTGNGTGGVTVTGPAAEINAALTGLAFTRNLNFNGPDTLTVATSDGTGADTDTMAITVKAVNDAPVNTVPAARPSPRTRTLPIAGVSVADIDSSALTTTLCRSLTASSM